VRARRRTQAVRWVPYISDVYRFVLSLLAAMPMLLSAQYPAHTEVRMPQLLVGTWEGGSGDARYREEWTPAGPSTFDGVARTLERGQVTSEERMRLTLFAEQWVFMASTASSGVTSFVRVVAHEGTWIFENREHDFPQRIGYSVHADTLRAFIAHLDDQGQRVDFVLTRSK
jgi:hypothetical protein